MSAFTIILFIGIIQGVFLSLGLLVKNWGRKKQNPFFYALILLISVALLAKLLFDVERYHAFPHIWFFADIAAYAIGPLWYFTILKSIQPQVSLKTSDYFLLLPVLYHVFFLVYLLTLSRQELIQTAQLEWFDWSFYGFCLTVLIVNGGFIWKSRQLLQRYQDTRFPDLLIKGQYVFLGILSIWLISFIGSFFVNVGGNINLNVYHYAFVSLSFLTFGLAFFALIRPASFYFLTQTYDDSETYVLQQIAEGIQKHLEEEQPYLRADYNLANLSAAVQSNPVLTSKAINRVLATNFNDLINERRVRHFLKLAKQDRARQFTLWAIAQEAGFGNKATFYKSFRKNMGTNPKAYLSEA